MTPRDNYNMGNTFVNEIFSGRARPNQTHIVTYIARDL